MFKFSLFFGNYNDQQFYNQNILTVWNSFTITNFYKSFQDNIITSFSICFWNLTYFGDTRRLETMVNYMFLGNSFLVEKQKYQIQIRKTNIMINAFWPNHFLKMGRVIFCCFCKNFNVINSCSSSCISSCNRISKENKIMIKLAKLLVFLTTSKNELYQQWQFKETVLNPSAWVTVEIDFIDHKGNSGKSSTNRHGHLSFLTWR